MNYLDSLFSLEGRTAVVTGGGGVLCGAIAEGYLKAGATVLLWGRTMGALTDKKSELVEHGCDPERVHCLEVDLQDEARIATALEESLALAGEVDILVNGVGGSGVRTSLVETDAAAYEATLRLNLLAGCFLPSKRFCQHWLRAKRPGAILNIASMASYTPLSGAWAYSAAKAAVENQTKAMAMEMAPHGVRVNAIAPGFFLGKQNRHLLVNPDGSPTARGEKVLAHTPAGRFGQPDELRAAAIFLVSAGAAFVSGVTLPVDGAYLCHGV